MRYRATKGLVNKAMATFVMAFAAAPSCRHAITAGILKSGPNPAGIRLFYAAPKLMRAFAYLRAKKDVRSASHKWLSAVKTMLGYSWAVHGHLLSDFLVDWAGKSVRKTEVQSG